MGCCREDADKDVTPEDVIMSQMGNNPYSNFQNPDENPNAIKEVSLITFLFELSGNYKGHTRVKVEWFIFRT